MIRPTITLVLASLLALPLSAKEPKTPKELKDAPEVTFSTAAGAPIHTSDLKGHVVLLDFWASWCIPCRKSFPEIDALAREFKARGLVVIAVNVDEDQKNADLFLEKFPHSMTVAFDPKGTVAEAFKVQAMPSSMFLDRSGVIRKKHMGYTDKTISQFRAEVLELLGETE